MKIKIVHLWQNIQSSFWFIPGLILAGAIALAAILIKLDTILDIEFLKTWPLFFAASAASSRDLLTAVATSMITIAGIVFSVTLVALALTSSQYSSRVIPHFMRDRFTQIVLGVFVGIFAYCIVALRGIKGNNETVSVFSLSVLIGLGLAFLGIIFLIYFIHHVAKNIQASNIIAAIANETIAAIDSISPDILGQGDDEERKKDLPILPNISNFVVAKKSGYIDQIDFDALLYLAKKHKIIIRMERGIGEFVIENTPLISLFNHKEQNEDLSHEINASYSIDRQRSLHQDIAFGIRQIVDIALRALSPGINDSTTAVMCVNYLGAVMARLARRKIAYSSVPEEAKSHIIMKGPCFSSLLDEAFAQIRQNASNNITVLTHQLQALEMIAGQTPNSIRRQALWDQAELICAKANIASESPHDKATLNSTVERLSRIIFGQNQRK